MTKRVLALVLCILMLFGLAPTSFAVGTGGADAHSGHDTVLQGLMTASGYETDHCGQFYCNDCQESYYAPISYSDVGMPIVSLTGSLAGVSKENKVTVQVSYSSAENSFTSSATLKVQGSSSASYPKKNYTIQFLKDNGSKNKVCLDDLWGMQSKYCLKANWVDFSQSRNVVSGQLFEQIVHSRGFDDELDALGNGGVVDGFPVLVYLNGDYYGMYTMNIPKDSWMFGMTGDGNQALLFGDTWAQSPSLYEEIADVNNVAASGWDLEYCSTDDSAWVAQSMNEFIRFLNNNDGESFKAGIDAYTDIDRAIDVLIFTYFIHACDNTSKNIIWATYDGVKWIPSVYDLDGTWGMVWDGSFTYSSTDFLPSGSNLLFQRLLDNYPDRIKARYIELREDVLSYSNIAYQFSEFFAKIPQYVYSADGAKWTGIPSQSINNYSQIIKFAEERLDCFDTWFGVEITEKSDSAYKARICAPLGTSVYVYSSQDYTLEPKKAISAYSATQEGVLTKTDGQINFKVVVPDGYEVKKVTAYPSENYKNIKGPGDTGAENTYRITKLKGDISVSVSVQKETDPTPKGYNVAFECDNAKVYVYESQDYSKTPLLADKTVSVDSDTLLPTQSGDGQVNFIVVPDYGYAVSEVSVSPKNYKNLKGYEEIGIKNVYRITKISGDIKVKVSTEKLPPLITITPSVSETSIGKTVVFTANAEFMTEGAYIVWNVSGSKK